jgi:hypothetical protein
MMSKARGRKPARGVASWSWVVAVPLACGFGCGNSSDSASSNAGTGGGGLLCIPGIQIACTCKSGADGAQACKADGSGFGACLCEAGGSSNGGISGSGTGGGASSAGSQPVGGEAGESGGGATSAGGATGDSGAGGGAGAPFGDATDFPTQAILESGVPANAPELFAAASDASTNPLCVLEPQLSSGSTPGAMFPSNWVRPRFRVSTADFDLYQIRLHTAAERNDLVVYTTMKTWYLPKNIWHGQGSNAGLGAAAAGGEVSVTIRALNTSAPLTAASVSGSFDIAPAVASGSILFTTRRSVQSITPDWSKLLGFSIGDEGVQAALTLPQVSWAGQFGEDGAVLNGYYDSPKLAGFADGSVRWLGRPALTPDGKAVVFSDDWPYAMAFANLTVGSVGSVPTYLGSGALGLLRMVWLGSPTLSPAHWAAKDRILVSSYATTFKSGAARKIPWQALPSYAGTGGATEDDKVKWHSLAWFDLEANFAVDLVSLGYGGPSEPRSTAVTAAKGTSWDLLATGDKNVSNVSPSFNPTGDTLAYVATDYSPTGEPDALATKADIRLVPYNDHKGGLSQPLTGASDPSTLEYQPTFSPDGKFIAFTRAAASGPDGAFRNRSAEVTVIPASGGSATRLIANDPNACAGDSTPLALINGSPAWGPSPVHQGGRSYYFLLFTSARKYGDEFATQFELDGLDLLNKPRASTQLYLTTIVVDDATGTVASYPAIYIWNQNRVAASGVPSAYATVTPVWGTTALPPQSIPPVP